MAASNTDLFRRATSGTRPESAYLTAPKSVGATTISLSTTTGWATTTGTDFIIYRKNTDNTMVPGTLTTWVGVAGSGTITNMILKAGTEPVGGYAAGEQSVVIATPTAAWNDALISGILTQHNQDGTHGATTHTSISTDTITEKTPSNGVTVAGLNIKSNKLNTNGSVPTQTVLFSGAKVGKTANQTITTATGTDLTWTNEEYDTDSYHDNVTNNTRLTVPATPASRYITLGLILAWTSWTGTTRMIVTLKKNGSSLTKLYEGQVTSGDDQTMTFTFDLLASANDYFEIQVFQQTGGNRDVGTNSKFWIKSNGV